MKTLITALLALSIFTSAALADYMFFAPVANTQQQIEDTLSLFPVNNPPNMMVVGAGIDESSLQYLKDRDIYTVLVFSMLFEGSQLVANWQDVLDDYFANCVLCSDDSLIAFIAVHDEPNVKGISNATHEQVVDYLRLIGINTPIIYPGEPLHGDPIVPPPSTDCLKITTYDHCNPNDPFAYCNPVENFQNIINQVNPNGLAYVLTISGGYEGWRHSPLWFPLSVFDDTYEWFYSQMWAQYGVFCLNDPLCVGIAMWDLSMTSLSTFHGMPALHNGIQLLNSFRDTEYVSTYTNTYNPPVPTPMPTPVPTPVPHDLTFTLTPNAGGLNTYRVEGYTPFEPAIIKYSFDTNGTVSCTNGNTPIMKNANVNGVVEGTIDIPGFLPPSTFQATNTHQNSLRSYTNDPRNKRTIATRNRVRS